MPLKNTVFLAGAAYAFRGSTDKRVAFLYDSKNFKVLGVGSHTGPSGGTWQTAITNVIQQQGSNSLGEDVWCVSSYPPSHMCWGMASVRQIKKFIWVENNSHSVPEVRWSRNLTDAVADWMVISGDEALTHPLTQTQAFQKQMCDLHGAKGLREAATNVITALLAPDKWRTQRVAMDDVLLNAFCDVPGTTPTGTLGNDDEHDLRQALAMALVGMTWNPKAPYWDTAKDSGEKFGGNNVGAVIFHNKKLIAWGVNAMAQNPTFHAESAAIQAYLEKNKVNRLPDGCLIYSSLQPCKMCAGLIVHVAKDANVIYGMDDQSLRTVLTGDTNPLGLLRHNIYGVNGCTHNRYTRSALRTRIETVLDALGEFEGPTTGILRSQFDDDYRKLISTPLPRRQAARLKAIESREEAREALGQRGCSFVAFGDYLFSLKGTGSLAHQQLVDHCLELLRVVARRGFATRYGLSLMNKLFPELAPSTT